MKILLCIDRWKIWYKLSPIVLSKEFPKIQFKLPHPKNIKRVTESVHNSTLIY